MLFRFRSFVSKRLIWKLRLSPVRGVHKMDHKISCHSFHTAVCSYEICQYSDVGEVDLLNLTSYITLVRIITPGRSSLAVHNSRKQVRVKLTTRYLKLQHRASRWHNQIFILRLDLWLQFLGSLRVPNWKVVKIEYCSYFVKKKDFWQLISQPKLHTIARSSFMKICCSDLKIQEFHVVDKESV